MYYYTFTVKYNDCQVSKIKVETDKLIKVYDEEIKNYYKFCKSLPKNAPRHSEFQNLVRLRKILSETETDLDFGIDGLYISSFSIKVIMVGEYYSMFCNECDKEYFPGQILSELWSQGETYLLQEEKP